MATVDINLETPEQAQKAVVIAVNNSIWFSVDPMPFDEFTLTVKPEAAHLFESLK